MRRQLWLFFNGWVVATALFVFSSHTSADSLWRDDARVSMVADRRARSVGDVLTILVQESNSTTKNNSTSTAKKASTDASISSFLYSPTASSFLTKNGQFPAMKYSMANDFTGGGKIANSEQITARISVRVIDVLPNNSLVIEGTRQTVIAGETQDAILRGVVRADDVAANNTVYSYNIADATIKYVSKGVVSDVQRKGWFTRIWDKIIPF